MTMAEQQHYDEDLLAAFADVPHELLADDEHLATCAPCAETLGTMRATASLLNCREIWDETPLPTRPPAESIEKLRTLAATMKEEDEIAETRVKQLLSKSSDTWAPTLREHPEWHTAGLVRRLIAATDRYNYTSPAEAVELTAAMVEVAEGVGDNSLRVDVLREHAYALGCVGRASEGMSVIADAICVGIDGVDPVTLGRALLVKTMFEAHLDHFERAASTAASAAILFSEAGDANRLLMARLYEGLVFVNRGDYREALNRFEGLDRNRLDVRSHASMLLAEAACHRSRNDVTRAERSFIACIEICDATQLLTLRRKAEWSFARLLMRNGSPARALTILRRLSDDFSELGLARESASLAVDVAEIFLALNRVAEARELALQALRYYKEEHLLAAASARAALALLSEAVKERKPTIEFIGDFRRLADERREVRLLTTVPVAIFGLS